MTSYFADGFKIRNNKGHEVCTHLDSGIKMVLNKPGSYSHRLHLKNEHSLSATSSTCEDLGINNCCVSSNFKGTTLHFKDITLHFKDTLERSHPDAHSSTHRERKHIYLYIQAVSFISLTYFYIAKTRKIENSVHCISFSQCLPAR